MIYINWEISDSMILDDSTIFGRAVFETILIKEKAIFLNEHIRRLKDGAEKLLINNRISANEVENFIKKENIKNCSFKIILTDKNIIIVVKEIVYTEKNYKEGFKLKLSNVRRNSTSVMTYIKSTNYIENILERDKAIKEGFDEVLFLNENNFITEGAISNIYFIENSKIKTAKVSCGLLDGTLRKWIIANYNVEEGNYSFNQLLNSDGVFISNSLLGVMRVSTIEGKQFGKNKIIEEVEKKYAEFIQRI